MAKRPAGGERHDPRFLDHRRGGRDRADGGNNEGVTIRPPHGRHNRNNRQPYRNWQ